VLPQLSYQQCSGGNRIWIGRVMKQVQDTKIKNNLER
jgi:hypothetical protein